MKSHYLWQLILVHEICFPNGSEKYLWLIFDGVISIVYRENKNYAPQ